MSRTPLFQAMLVLQNIPLRAQELAGLTVTDVSFDHAPVSNFELTLNVDEQPRWLDLSLVFNTDLFQTATIDRMLESYETLLREFVADRDQRVLEVSVLSTDQRCKQLVEWNNTDRPYPHEKCVHELIAEQRGERPMLRPCCTKEHASATHNSTGPAIDWRDFAWPRGRTRRAGGNLRRSVAPHDCRDPGHPQSRAAHTCRSIRFIPRRDSTR